MESIILFKLFESYRITDVLPKIQKYIDNYKRTPKYYDQITSLENIKKKRNDLFELLIEINKVYKPMNKNRNKILDYIKKLDQLKRIDRLFINKNKSMSLQIECENNYVLDRICLIDELKHIL